MKPKYLTALLVFLLVVPIIVSYGFLANDQTKKEPLDIFVGIDAAYEDMEEVKQLIDETSSYTNLFILGCTGITENFIPIPGGITENFTKLNEMCQYIYDKDMYFIVYREHVAPQTEWLEEAKAKWGDRFLGFYAYDEAGGWQLDLQELRVVEYAENYTDAANQFVDVMSRILYWYTLSYTNSTRFPLFTSDYALYWFDYKAGYDTIFAEFGWNYSRQLNVALCRGAATMHDRDWGAIVTWTYDNPPYIGSGKELYRDLILAYKNGAKYIIVFDTNENYTHGILGKEHLEALKRFWHYVQNNPRNSFPIGDRVAYVLPKDYAYGFRGPDDKIWGFWYADAFSDELCHKLGEMITKYEFRLDIIYDDGLEPNNTYGYSKLIFWNGTIVT
jgi:hypothetical protein